MFGMVSEVMRRLFIPSAWVFIVCYGVGAVLGILVPNALRGLVRVFTSKLPVCALGVVWILSGTAFFVGAEAAELTALVRVLGVLGFVSGGVSLLIPMLGVIVAESIRDRSNTGIRVFGLVCGGLTYLFFIAAKLAPVVEIAEPVLRGPS